jgi:hypothetical protein
VGSAQVGLAHLEHQALVLLLHGEIGNRIQQKVSAAAAARLRCDVHPDHQSVAISHLQTRRSAYQSMIIIKR